MRIHPLNPLNNQHLDSQKINLSVWCVGKPRDKHNIKKIQFQLITITKLLIMRAVQHFLFVLSFYEGQIL